MYNVVEVRNKFLTKMYLQMFFGILLTGVTMFWIGQDYSKLESVARYYNFILIGEVILVIALNALIGKMSSSMALAMFFIYSFMNGVTFSILPIAYDLSSIFYALGATSVVFLVMTIYGMTTKEDLSGYGKSLNIALWSLVIMGIINIFVKATFLDWLFSVVAIVLFTVLIAFDTNRIVKIVESASVDEETYKKFSIIGALMLYLDFINLFLNILRIFGGRKD